MGWNNEKKKEALQHRRSQLLTEIEQAEEAIQRTSRKESRLQEQLFAVKNIRDHNDFKSIHIAALQQAIHTNEEQAAKLKKSSDQLKVLTQQLEEIRTRLDLQEKENVALVGKKVLTENAIQYLEKERQHLDQFVGLIQEADKDLLLQFQQKHGSLAGEEQLTLENIDTLYGELMEKTEQAAKQHEEAADTQQLSIEREHSGEYIEWLQKLETENLPHYNKDFERLLHDTAVIKMGVLNEELESWERKIKNSITTLNQSLGGINFNRLPDTYIQLGIRPVTDTVIKEFRSRLLNALPQAADW